MQNLSLLHIYNLAKLLYMYRATPNTAYSRSKQQIPVYLASNYSRSSGLSISKGAFSYSNMRQPYNGNSSVSKDSKYIKQTNQYLYSNQTKDTQLSRIRQAQCERQLQEKRLREQKVINQYRIRNSRQKNEENNAISDQYYGRSANQTSKNDTSRISEENKNTLTYYNEPKHQIKNTSIGLVGLNNVGNTCFMQFRNSILQCMVNLPYFNDHFLENKYLKQLNSNSRIASAYGKLVHTMRNSTSRSQTPSEIKNAVAWKKPRFSGYAQQDAQQFLAALLQLLSLDLNRSRNPKYKQLTADVSKQSLQQISQQWWKYNRQRQNSIVCDYFTGQLLSKVVCRTCKNQSIAFDNTWDFALNFSHNDNGQIIRMLDNFLKEEVISNDYYCSKCKSFRQCQRKLDFFRLPNILVLQIKRFSYGKYSKQKLNNKIKVPQELNLSKLLVYSHHKSTQNPLYQLVGIVNHSGDINYGHYTADCLNPINNRWYNFNDSSVSETRISSIFESSSPYLLFYSKSQ